MTRLKKEYESLPRDMPQIERLSRALEKVLKDERQRSGDEAGLEVGEDAQRDTTLTRQQWIESALHIGQHSLKLRDPLTSEATVIMSAIHDALLNGSLPVPGGSEGGEL